METDRAAAGTGEVRPAGHVANDVSPSVAGRVLVGYAWRRRRLVWSSLALLVAALAGVLSFIVTEPTANLWLADVAIVLFVVGLAGLVRGRIVIFLAVVSLAMLPLAAILQARGRLGPGAPVDEFNRDWFFVTAALVVAAIARSIEQIAVIGWGRARGGSRGVMPAAGPAEPVAAPHSGHRPRRAQRVPPNSAADPIELGPGEPAPAEPLP